jgi:hypothetical protein
MEKAYRYYECPSRTPSRERTGATPHPSWRAAELEAEVCRQIAEWPDSIFLGVTMAPAKAGNGSAQRERIASAEREFMRMVRNVASGYGTMSDLGPPLGDLANARSGVDDDDEADAAPALRDAVVSNDPSTANVAIGAVAGRITVMIDSVEVEPRNVPVPA